MNETVLGKQEISGKFSALLRQPQEKMVISLGMLDCLDMVLRPETPIFASGLRLKLLSRMAKDREKETKAS